tara:strand:- start:409 stop:570 length:162 start_codon:yes stop_codon:yes gene_type:complete
VLEREKQFLEHLNKFSISPKLDIGKKYFFQTKLHNILLMEQFSETVEEFTENA